MTSSAIAEILMQSAFAVIGKAVARMLVGIGVGATITGIAVSAPQASSSQNLFTPGVALVRLATATTLASDAYASLPVELRLLALGLPLSSRSLKKAAQAWSRCAMRLVC
jgi:hypothetical protein